MAAVPRWLTEVGPTSGYGARSPTGFHPTRSGRRGGPVVPTLGKRQAVEAAGVNRVASAELDVVAGGLRWGFDLIFFSYGGGEA
jgi:hypothetical protein